MEDTALPEELIRCWEDVTVDENGREKVRKRSLMQWKDVPQYRTAFFNKCISLFNRWHLFDKAPPFGNGWANERAVTVEILELLERENSDYDAWLREREDATRPKF